MTRAPARRRVASIAATALCVAACSSSYQMGDVIKTDPNATQAASANAKRPAAAAPSTKNSAEFDEWSEKWRVIQSSNDSIGWVDHLRVCGIKYRYRNYDELFRCLDLFEAKIANGRKSISHYDVVRRATPVITAWMRANVYSELGEPDVALKWAETAWNAMPEDYRATRQSIFGGQARTDFTWVAAEVGGSLWDDDDSRTSRDNPAGLDISAETIAMSLAAQRSILYQHLGRPQEAQVALAELLKWQDIREHDNFTGFIPTSAPYKTKVQLLSMGPLFAMADYARVVKAYDDTAADQDRKRHQQQVANGAGWVLLFPFKLRDSIIDTVFFKPFTPSDARLFAVAVEDVSNALVYAQSLARIGKTQEAGAMLDTLLALPEIRAMGNLYWVALYERAAIDVSGGKRPEAIELLERSVDAIEMSRSTIAFEAAKIGFAGDKQVVYGALVDALAQAGDWNAAFVAAERAKARALVDLLAQRRDLVPPPGVDDRVRDLFSHATTVESDVGLPGNDATVRGIKIVADSRSELMQAAPAAASLVTVQPLSIDAVSQRIGRDETLIDYYRAGDTLFAFVLNGATIAGSALPAKGLDDDVRAFRAAIERRDRDAAMRGRALYARLIEPLAPQLAGAKLTISPYGALHYLPFVALLDGDRYLVDEYAVRIVPSAATLAFIQTGEPAKAGKLLALGNPDLGDARFDLPNAQTEAVNVAALFPDSRALLRGDASKTAIEQLGGGFSMLHFATHGKFNADDPLRSGLYLASGGVGDGVLTVADLYTQQWDMDLITLSACETGLGKVASGDDVIGLTRGFLYAGARSIVASLWEVDDAATERLMVDFYRNLASHDKREALRLAQIDTRSAYPDPMYWAAFQIIGRAE
jgi:CHAT domain-containing protein